MGRRGPLPMSQGLRLLRGDQSGRTTGRTLKLKPGTPAPPTVLKGEALAEWKRIVPVLEEKAVLSKADRGILTLYCEAWAISREARKALEKGLTTEGGSDRGVRRHPMYTIWRESTALAAQLAKELLITPATRLRTSLPEPNDDEQTAAAALLD